VSYGDFVGLQEETGMEVMDGEVMVVKEEVDGEVRNS